MVEVNVRVIWLSPSIDTIGRRSCILYLHHFSAWRIKNTSIRKDKIWSVTECRIVYGTRIRLVPAQDEPFYYTRSHLSALQNCALLFLTNFQFIFIFKKCITQFSHWIVSCTIVFSKILHRYLLNSRTVL